MVPPRTFVILALLAIVGSSSPRVLADKAKALEYIELGEKYLEGRSRSYSRALKAFSTARKLLGSKPDKVSRVRVALGLGKAYLGKRRYRDAAKELAVVAKEHGPRQIPARSLARGEAKAWEEALIRIRKEVDGGRSGTSLIKELVNLSRAAGASKAYKRLEVAANYLLGRCYEMKRRSKDAANFYLPVVEAYLAALKRTSPAKGSAPSAAPPKNIPKAEAPPGKLAGKYKDAVDSAIDWLLRHQLEDGSWSDDRISERCEKKSPCPPGRTRFYDSGSSQPLVLLALIRAGVRISEDPRGVMLQKAVDCLLEIQTPAGLLVKTASATFEHALATWALAEVLLTHPDRGKVKEALAKAVSYMTAAQNPGCGWRHGIRPGDNDSLHTSICMLALARAKAAGVQFKRKNHDDAFTYLDKLTDEKGGRTGWMMKHDAGVMRGDARGFKAIDHITPIALAARLLWKADPSKNIFVSAGFSYMWRNKPTWEENRTIHFQYWMYYTLAYVLKKGPAANFSLLRLVKFILDHQEKKGCARGCWAAMGVMSTDGRAAATARALLTILNARGVNLPDPADPEDLEKEE